jgi:hypothetical protein
MIQVQNTISEDVVNDVQNLMLMSKLSEGVEVYLKDREELENCYVVINTVPFAYRHFVILMSALLRGAGNSVYDESLWEQIYDVWQAFGYKYESYKQKHHTTFVRKLITATAKHYATPDEMEKVDFKPMMAEVYLKLTNQ